MLNSVTMAQAWMLMYVANTGVRHGDSMERINTCLCNEGETNNLANWLDFAEISSDLALAR